MMPSIQYSQQSLMTIGGYDVEEYAPNTTLSWNPIVGDDLFWTVELTSLSLGGE